MSVQQGTALWWLPYDSTELLAIPRKATCWKLAFLVIVPCKLFQVLSSRLTAPEQSMTHPTPCRDVYPTTMCTSTYY